MKTLSLSHLLYLLLVALSASPIVQAEPLQLERIELQSIPAQDVIPLIKPFLAENAAISAEGYTITLQTTPENMRQVKKLIRDLDVPAKQLHISVSLDPWVILQSQIKNKSQRAAQSEMTAGENESVANPTADADTTVVYKTTGREVMPGIQVIKVLQNRWSMIRTGQSIPVTQRIRNPDGTITESISYQQVNQGLRIKPHLTEQQVTLYVQPFYEADNQTEPGKKLYYKAQKVANTRLGRWFGLETTSGVPMPADINWIKQNQVATNPIPLIYLKVDLAP